MKIMFIDPMGRDYDTRTPYQQALGGTQSAVAYLSAELVKLGHQVTVINGVAAPRTVDGVQFMALPVETAYMNGFDVVIAVASALGERVRAIGCTRPMVMWCHHAINQSAVAGLSNPAETGAFQGFAMVSAWQAQTYIGQFGLPVEKIRVARNAVSPSFQQAAIQKPWYERGDGPVLAYTSTPFRGLEALLLAFPLIRTKVPGARLKVFSGMGVYGAADDDFASLYEMARALPGVEYVGPLPQAQLAEAMAGVDILSYPSTFAETACIAAMEAMAVGATVVTTDLGALAETTAGFGVMMPPSAEHPVIFATRYAKLVTEFVTGIDPAAGSQRRTQQIEFARTNYSWATRAREWEVWLAQLAQG